MEYRLTREMDAMICVLYKAYLERRESGEDKGSAKHFEGSTELHDQYFRTWREGDVAETIRELSADGLLVYARGGDRPVECVITKEAIYYMEKRFINGIKSILEHLAKLRQFVPI